jgi:hypothetical protein
MAKQNGQVDIFNAAIVRAADQALLSIEQLKTLFPTPPGQVPDRRR